MMKSFGLVETHHQLTCFKTPQFVSVFEKVE